MTPKTKEDPAIPAPPEVETVDAKHIFIDIVNYTHNRSVEAQADLIDKLNIAV